MAGVFNATIFNNSVFNTGGVSPGVVQIDGGMRPRRHPRHSIPKLKPEEIARQQRMVQDYLDSLEPKAPAVIQRKAPTFTAALARAAADVQLTQVVRAAAAVQDRALAAEELRQRRLKLVLLLALD